MIKLNYKATTTFTSRDIDDISETLLSFEVWVNRPMHWTATARQLIEVDFDDLDLALKLIGLSLVAVIEDETRHRIGSVEQAKALMKAIEAANPGYGDQFIKHLALGIFKQQIEREEQTLGNLPNSSSVSAAGVETAS